MLLTEVKRRRPMDRMAVDETNTEGGEVFKLPPRKRFKVIEKQRQREEEEVNGEEECPRVLTPCNGVKAKAVRVSPKKIHSRGFLVLEKQKYKRQQQELKENRIPGIPPLPPRPIAVEQKEVRARPAPPVRMIKFHGEKGRSLSPSAFKRWGSSSLASKLATSEIPLSENTHCGAQKDASFRIKTRQPASFGFTSVVDHSKAWKMSNGTTCSINKAQEDIDVVCEVPVDLISEGNQGSQIASPEHIVGGAQISEVDTATSEFCSPFLDDDVQDVSVVEADGTGSKDAKVVITADLECFDPMDGTDVADDVADDVSHSSPGNATIVDRIAHVETLPTNGKEELGGDSHGMHLTFSAGPVVEPALENHVDSADYHGAVKSEEWEEGKTLIGARDVEDLTDRGHATTAALGEAEACTLSDPLTSSSPMVASVERHSTESSNNSKLSEELTTNANCVNENKIVMKPVDESAGNTCSAGELEEPAAPAVADVEGNEGVVPRNLSDPFAVAGEPDLPGTDSKREKLLAQIDERADCLFKRMFEREGDGDSNVEHDSIADSLASYFYAVNGVDHTDSPAAGMEAEMGPALNSQETEIVRASMDDDSVVCTTPFEDRQIDLGRSSSNLAAEGQCMTTEEIIVETPKSSCRATSEAREDSSTLEDQEIECPFSSALKHGTSRRLKEQSRKSECKSSKEDSDWDLAMEITEFSCGKRSGMTQRVEAPGHKGLSQRSEVDSTTLYDDAEAETETDENDGACDVCLNPDAEPSDPIVYCDGCDVPVHADCYGNPLSHVVPEGDWFCAQCLSRSRRSRTCSLCPRSGGAMKMTTDGNWAHLSCAVFVPEVFFRKADDLEEIDTSHVPSKRWLSTCCVCNSTGGACVDCTEIGCKSSFHVSCALKKDLALELRGGRSGAIVISFCQVHTAAWNEQQELRKAGRSKYKIVSREPQKRSKLR